MSQRTDATDAQLAEAPPLLALAGSAAAVVLAAVAACEALGSKLLEALVLQLAFGAAVWALAAHWRRSAATMLAGLAALIVLALSALWANGFDVALYQISGLPAECQRLISL